MTNITRRFWGLSLLLLLGVNAARADAGAQGLVVADCASPDVPCAEALQRLIDTNPNREIFLPDGIYLLDKPICTPADPQRSVALRLSNYARLKAVANWAQPEAMIRLGATHPANDIVTPGSWYWIAGGIIDGNGRADGISIDGGRETVVRDLSIKGTRVGLRIKRGANSGSSDCDIQNVNIVGNGAADSVGVIIEGHDNTLSKMRIAKVVTGVRVTASGQMLRDIHPLFNCDSKKYPASIGFDIRANDVWGDYCYSDQFATGFKIARGKSGIFDKCYCYWYASGAKWKHTAIEATETFEAQFTGFTCWFKNAEADNALLTVGMPGGRGFLRDTRADATKINSPRDRHAEYSVSSRPLR